MKKILYAILTVGVMVGCFKLLDKEYDNSVNSCIQQGHDVSYCEYHAG